MKGLLLVGRHLGQADQLISVQDAMAQFMGEEISGARVSFFESFVGLLGGEDFEHVPGTVVTRVAFGIFQNGHVAA